MSDVTFIGGRAVKCLDCLNIYTTHHTHHPSRWCNWCQCNTQHESWVFLSGGDVDRRACAEPQPGDHDRLIAPLCSLATDHDGDHVDGITRRSWPRGAS